MDDPDHPHACPEWRIRLNDKGNVLLSLAHSPTPEDYLAGRNVRWAYLVLTPQQAAALGKGLMKVERDSLQLMGEET